MACGVLALQGDFAAHLKVLDRLGAAGAAVRTVADLAAVDALVIPGGESTTMLRLMRAEALFDATRDRIRAGMPVLGTCAGMVLLARDVRPAQPTLGLLDVVVQRNAYGRQPASAVVPLRVDGALPGPRTMDGVFIRAPRIVSVEDGVQPLAWRGEDPVLVRQGNVVASTFHPELTDDTRAHGLLLDAVGAPCATSGVAATDSSRP